MNGRDKRRRVKARREQTHNPVGVTVLPKITKPVYGRFCRVRQATVDISVCTVQSVRTPDLCRGCA